MDPWDWYLGTDRWWSGRAGHFGPNPRTWYVNLLRRPLGTQEQIELADAIARAKLRYPPLPLT